MVTIKETRVDDIRAAQQKWDSDFEQSVNAYNKMEYDYDMAIETVMEQIETKIRAELGVTDDDLLEITADAYGGKFGGKYRTGIKYKYGAPFDKKSALNWHIDIYLNDDGEVQKETGSWSGLEVQTPELLADLKYSVSLIEKIMNLDYQKIIMDAENARPNRDDYITGKRPNRGNRPDFDKQIKEATIEDIIGTNTIIKGEPVPASGYRKGSIGWYKIVSQTPKRYTVAYAPNYLINDKDGLERALNYTFTVNKDKLYDVINDNIETMDI